MMRKAEQGYVLMVVAVALVVIATLSLSLFADTNENAQKLQSRYELQQLQYSLDAGIEHAKAQLLSNQSCSGYSTVSGSVPGATYVSTLGTTSGSPVEVKIIATHSSGLQRSAEFNLSAYTNVSSLSLAPTEDTHVKKDQPDENKGDDKKMHSQAKGDDKDEHMLLLFDVDSVPKPSFIQLATLQMELDSSNNDDDPDNIYRLGRSWKADEATWSKYQSGFLSYWLEPGGQHQYHVWGSFPDSIEGTKTADVTSLTRLWHGGLANHGMLLRSEFDANNSHKQYFSTNEGNVNRRPKLSIEYRCECATTC